MTKTEFKKLIAESTNLEWFKTKEVLLSAPKTSFSREFNDIITLYDFLFSETKKWEDCKQNIPAEIVESKVFFQNLKSRIESFVQTYSIRESNQFDIYWNNHKMRNYINTSSFIFTFDQPETAFLIDLYNKDRQYFNGAFCFFTNQMNSIFNQKDSFIGASLANEFFGKNTIHKYSRKDTEQKSFDKLRQEFEETIQEASSTVVDHLKNSNDKYEEYAKKIDELKLEKDEDFEDWFHKATKEFDKFNSASHDKIDELEKLYREKLVLEAPADYWEKRANSLLVEGNWWLGALALTTIIGVILLYSLLKSIGAGEFETMFKNTGSSIKWSIVLITFISFLAFLIKTFAKLVFSSFHLSRDAQERKQLTLVYLAMKENNAVTDNDRGIILQSLFSRADTGLLKEDSSPTMPTSIFEKAVK
jgi:hypothetical protein